MERLCCIANRDDASIDRSGAYAEGEREQGNLFLYFKRTKPPTKRLRQRKGKVRCIQCMKVFSTLRCTAPHDRLLIRRFGVRQDRQGPFTRETLERPPGAWEARPHSREQRHLLVGAPNFGRTPAVGLNNDCGLKYVLPLRELHATCVLMPDLGAGAVSYAHAACLNSTGELFDERPIPHHTA